MTFNFETSIVLGAIALIGFAFYRMIPRTMHMVQPQRIRVISGDTVEIDRETCRVYGIEGPHWAEPGAPFAKHRLHKMVEVAAYFTVRRLGRDKSGQVVIRMTTDHDVDVAANLVSDGTVFSYLDAEYPYGRLMDEARAAYRGIWSDPQATAAERRGFDRDYVWYGDVLALLLRRSAGVAHSELSQSSNDPAPQLPDRPALAQPLLRTPLGEPVETPESQIRTIPREWRPDAAVAAANDTANEFQDKEIVGQEREVRSQSENGMGGSSGRGLFGLGDLPINPCKARGLRRVIVLDASSQNYLAAILEALGVEGFYVQSGDDFIAQVRAYRPHLAFVHVFNVKDILRLKADPEIAGTPIVVLNSIDHYGECVMSDAGLTGPTLSVPFAQEEIQLAIDCWGRGDDQPFPEPVPYQDADLTLNTQGSDTPDCAYGERKILIRCRDFFYRTYLARTIEQSELLPISLKAPPGGFEKFAADIAARKPALLVWFDDNGYFLRNVGASLAPLGIRTLVLTSHKHDLHPHCLGEGADAMPHHLLPMPKDQLLKVIEDLIEKRP